ncbi:MAG TPA: FKBP-type peptidyl-prolyl cis-trans isomerase, partial [Ramlibacter sp.]|nr:FKBP-type peptidyl-prolyl cis-trans isomerase [Ramlibacter sp.]
TFGGNPATLALGSGELVPGLEKCLAHAEPGGSYVFELEPAQAFGDRREALVQSLPRASFARELELEEGGLIEFSAPDGTRHAGRVRALHDHDVLVDFNHPLAGRRVRFEVEVLAIVR